jgi:hypothetical protein
VRVTVDRGEMMHALGRARLSPAIRDGVPALTPPGDTAGRCGWADFFGAVEARGLALEHDPDGAAPPRLVPAPAAAATNPGGPAHHAGLPRRGALAEARRFLDALRGRWPPRDAG